jgi:hypothetical protein
MFARLQSNSKKLHVSRNPENTRGETMNAINRNVEWNKVEINFEVTHNGRGIVEGYREFGRIKVEGVGGGGCYSRRSVRAKVRTRIIEPQ